MLISLLLAQIIIGSLKERIATKLLENSIMCIKRKRESKKDIKKAKVAETV